MQDTEFITKEALSQWEKKNKQYKTFSLIYLSTPLVIHIVIILLSSQLHSYQPLYTESNIWFNILYTILTFAIIWFSLGLLLVGFYTLFWWVPFAMFMENHMDKQLKKLSNKWHKDHPHTVQPFPYTFPNHPEECYSTISQYLIYVITFLALLSVSGFVDIAIFPGVFFTW